MIRNLPTVLLIKLCHMDLGKMYMFHNWQFFINEVKQDTQVNKTNYIKLFFSILKCIYLLKKISVQFYENCQ